MDTPEAGAVRAQGTLLSRGVRELAALAVAGAASLAGLWIADVSTPRAAVRAGGPFDQLVLRKFGAYRQETGSRGANESSRVELRGLWASAPVAVSLDVASPMQPRRVRFHAGGQVVERRIGEAAENVRLDAHTDHNGALSIRFSGVRSEGTALRLSAVAVAQEDAAVPRWRLLLYALFGPAWLLVSGRRPDRVGAVGLALTVVSVAAAIHFARLPVLAAFPRIALALALTAAFLLVGDALAAVLSAPVAATRWVALAAIVQLLLVAHPRFGMIDAPWHTRNLWTFRTGGLTVSTAPGLDQVPYPPAFYAALSPVATGAPESDLLLVRMAMAVLVATTPLLVFALMRAGGASPPAAAGGMVAAALMPEAVLVLAKGIACNIFAASMTLVVLVAALRRVALPVLGGLLVIACLSHVGAAASLVLLLALWWTWQRVRGELDLRRFLLQVGALGAAALFAWALYYREVSAVIEPTGIRGNPAVGEVRWFRVGKIGQDLLLKFGLLPLVLAVIGMRAPVPPALRTLLGSWLLVGLGLALVAVLTPFPLRFEYFVMPAVAIAAGLGAAELSGRDGAKTRWVALAWAFVFGLQVLLGVLLLHDRFEIIAVIMESPRWPFPFKLDGP